MTVWVGHPSGIGAVEMSVCPGWGGGCTQLMPMRRAYCDECASAKAKSDTLLQEGRAVFGQGDYQQGLKLVAKAYGVYASAGGRKKPMSDENRTCEFCGCITNAKARACCAEGRDADDRASKERAQFETMPTEKTTLLSEAARFENELIAERALHDCTKRELTLSQRLWETEREAHLEAETRIAMFDKELKNQAAVEAVGKAFHELSVHQRNAAWAEIKAVESKVQAAALVLEGLLGGAFAVPAPVETAIRRALGALQS